MFRPNVQWVNHATQLACNLVPHLPAIDVQTSQFIALAKFYVPSSKKENAEKSEYSSQRNLGLKLMLSLANKNPDWDQLTELSIAYFWQ